MISSVKFHRLFKNINFITKFELFRYENCQRRDHVKNHLLNHLSQKLNFTFFQKKNNKNGIKINRGISLPIQSCYFQRKI